VHFEEISPVILCYIVPIYVKTPVLNLPWNWEDLKKCTISRYNEYDSLWTACVYWLLKFHDQNSYYIVTLLFIIKMWSNEKVFSCHSDHFLLGLQCCVYASHVIVKLLSNDLDHYWSGSSCKFSYLHHLCCCITKYKIEIRLQSVEGLSNICQLNW